MRQEVRFCVAPDGSRIAFAIHGSGPPLVRTATWLTHLELDWESPVWRHWLDGLAERHTVVRYDERGCGLSDRDVEDLSLDARVGDLEAVIDAAGLERVALVLHARDDALVPFSEGRLLATLVPGARFVPLESHNHILLADEPAWERFRSELNAFLPPTGKPVRDDLGELSNRELDVLALVAEGLGNEEIAARLYLSIRTVERHLSNIYAKLRISGKAARAAAAVRFSQSR